MLIFNLVFFKILTALLSVLVGFLSGKYGNVSRDAIASLLFFFIAPIVFFAIPVSTKMEFASLGITLLTFILCVILSVISYYLYGFIWKDNHLNILALSAGTGNSAFVVFPIAVSIFDDATLTIYALGLIGISIYEASVGCYYCARSINSFKESVIKIIKLPILNAFFLGCIMSLIGFKLPDFLDDFILNMKGTFAILGMVIIGLAISKIDKLEFDAKFIAAAFTSKFIFYPIIFNLFIVLDYYLFGFYDKNYYDALQLLCIAPLATNVIVLASLYKIHPEKVATTVLLSLVFSLIYIPFMSSLFLQKL